jgi:hypothetical protein
VTAITTKVTLQERYIRLAPSDARSGEPNE